MSHDATTTDVNVVSTLPRTPPATETHATHTMAEMGTHESKSKDFGSKDTLISATEGRKATSVRSAQAGVRKRILEAKQELLQRELEAAQAAARLARVKMELAECESELLESDSDENDFKSEHVENWIAETNYADDNEQYDPRDVCMFASQINNSVAAIKGLKRPEYLQAPHIVKTILDKLPQSFLYRWYDFIGDEEHGVSDITRVSQWLNREADRCGSHVSLGETNNWKMNRKNVYYGEENNVASYTSTSESKNMCFHCKKDHVLSECPQFMKLTIQERWDIVKKHRVCFNCLKGKHRKENCRKSPCKHCKRWHHSLLHVEYAVQKPDSDSVHQEPVTTNTVNNVCAPQMSRAYLKMLEIEIFGPKGSEKIIALLDEGSTVTLLDSAVANRIGASGSKTQLVIQTVGGGNIVNSDTQVINLTLKGVNSKKVLKLKQVCTIDNLKLTPQYLDKKRIEQCRHLRNLVDQIYYEAQAPMMLIGQDNWQLLASKQMRKGKPGQPVASRTALGWVLHGVDTTNTARSVNVINTCFVANSNNVMPQFEINNIKSPRDLQVKDYALTTHNNTCTLKFIDKNEHVTRKGRYKSNNNCSNMSLTKTFRDKVPLRHNIKQKPNVHNGEMNRRVNWSSTRYENWRYRKFGTDGIHAKESVYETGSIANHRD
ncbi:unnamed protein product [Colias eurytheme]|nr:unnamed protein product [Colias eurytheme]